MRKSEIEQAELAVKVANLHEVIVRDQSIKDLIPIQPMSYDDAVRAALRERRECRQARS